MKSVGDRLAMEYKMLEPKGNAHAKAKLIVSI